MSSFVRFSICASYCTLSMKSVLQGVWGTPHQAKGGDSSESPPAVFWLQKTLLAKDLACLLLIVPYLLFHFEFGIWIPTVVNNLYLIRKWSRLGSIHESM